MATLSHQCRIVAPGLTKDTVNSEAEILGLITCLWTQSDIHRQAPIHLLPSQLFPVIKQEQYILLVENNQPIFYLSWAMLNKEAEFRYLQNAGSYLEAEDWSSGERMWITDYIAPYGHSFAAVRYVLRTALADRWMRWLYHQGQQKGLRIIEGRGIAVKRKVAQAWFRDHPAQLTESI